MKSIKDFKRWLRGYMEEAKKNNIDIDDIIEEVAKQVELLSEQLDNKKLEKIVIKEIEKFPYNPPPPSIPPYNSPTVVMYGCPSNLYPWNGQISITTKMHTNTPKDETENKS